MLGTLAQETTVLTSDEANGLMAALGAYMVVWLIVAIFMIVVMWKIFTKAGKPGWACIIPIYNTIVMLEIVGRPVWWIFLLFVPIVNIVIWIIVLIDMAKSFGKGTGFGLGLIFLSIIFFPILAFGSATYRGPAAVAGGSAPPPAPPAPPAG